MLGGGWQLTFVIPRRIVPERRGILATGRRRGSKNSASTLHASGESDKDHERHTPGGFRSLARGLLAFGRINAEERLSENTENREPKRWFRVSK
jgi:hypothetical protein